MADYETIVYELRDGVARLTLNRPDKLNSFNVAMHLEVRDAIARTGDGGARVLLLTGAGRAFSAGQDLGDRAVSPASAAPARGNRAPESARAKAGGAASPQLRESGAGRPRQEVDLGASIEEHYAPLVLSLRALPLPVVCAVNGVAAGAGANLALACDLVLAARSAVFYQPFCKLGLVPDTGGTWFMPRLVGTARALGLALLGDKLTAEHAAAWGLIWRVVPDEELPAAVDALVAHLAQAPTRGLARTKQAIYASALNSLEDQLDVERDFQRELGNSADYREGVAAFLEKRPPNFIGK